VILFAKSSLSSLVSTIPSVSSIACWLLINFYDKVNFFNSKFIAVSFSIIVSIFYLAHEDPLYTLWSG